MIADTIEELVGNTPLLRIHHLELAEGVTLLAKCEFFNPTSSVKDRIAANMVLQAIKRGAITPNTMIIEPTSGNTGIGLAAICAAKGLKLTIVMPDSMSIERRKLMQHLGAELVLTPAAEGMQGSIDRALKLRDTLEDAVVLQQFQNPDNPDAHRRTTAPEILKATDGTVDIFVAGVGTGGTITGTGEVLKEQIPHLQIVAVEPANSPILSQGRKGAHKIEGIGAGFVPDILNRDLIDEVLTVTNEDAYAYARSAAREAGLLVGISSGANLAAAHQVAQRKENQGKTIVTILPDTAERYLSTELFI